MTHDIGTRLDGMHDVESMRLRCVCDPDSGCWHLRTARGRAYPAGTRQTVWVYGVGTMTATRAMWTFHTGKEVPSRFVVGRTCGSFDCVNPEHLRMAKRGVLARDQFRAGHMHSERRSNAARDMGRKRARITPELRRWLLESPQSGSAAAHALGISQGRANKLRADARERSGLAVRSVFELARVAA